MIEEQLKTTMRRRFPNGLPDLQFETAVKFYLMDFGDGIMVADPNKTEEYILAVLPYGIGVEPLDRFRWW